MGLFVGLFDWFKSSGTGCYGVVDEVTDDDLISFEEREKLDVYGEQVDEVTNEDLLGGDEVKITGIPQNPSTEEREFELAAKALSEFAKAYPGITVEEALENLRNKRVSTIEVKHSPGKEGKVEYLGATYPRSDDTPKQVTMTQITLE